MMESLAKSIRFPTDLSSVSLSSYYESLPRTAKVEQWWVETSRSLCTCLSLMDIVKRRPIDAIVTFSELFVGPCVDLSEVIDEGSDHAAAPSFRVMC